MRIDTSNLTLHLTDPEHARAFVRNYMRGRGLEEAVESAGDAQIQSFTRMIFLEIIRDAEMQKRLISQSPPLADCIFPVDRD